ncbi:hypothetical protein [Ahrensia sp. 13_GOM-1096m]|uniref:hypothetical protein n=1 Tax=Ahrensia sp. 13_GOM-1096m TaxID=1380380 RepID=UPI00047B5EE2|nr:hypothetical protein [Ahrensia sp. 13_GOM-1096m]
MLSGFSNIYTPSNPKRTENQNQQTQPKAEEQGQAQGPSSQNNSTGSQNAGSTSSTQAPSAASGQSSATLHTQTAKASMENIVLEEDEGTSSFNEAAYMRRVAERVQSEMALNSIFNIKDESNVLPNLFAPEAQESEPINKAALREYMKNSEPA